MVARVVAHAARLLVGANRLNRGRGGWGVVVRGRAVQLVKMGVAGGEAEGRIAGRRNRAGARTRAPAQRRLALNPTASAWRFGGMLRRRRCGGAGLTSAGGRSADRSRAGLCWAVCGWGRLRRVRCAGAVVAVGDRVVWLRVESPIIRFGSPSAGRYVDSAAVATSPCCCGWHSVTCVVAWKLVVLRSRGGAM